RAALSAAPAAAGTPPPSAPTGVPVRGSLRSASGANACGVLPQGQLVCWGENGLGQLGGGVSDSAWHAPVQIAGREVFRSVSVGATHNCALTTAGKAYCWGYGANGE